MMIKSLTLTICIALLLSNTSYAAKFKSKKLAKGDCSKGQARVGDTVQVHYRGTLKDGTQFDSSYDRSMPLELTLGKGMVIQCWEKGIQGLCVGEKRLLTCPPALAYGESGFGGVIPPNSVLKFEVELVSVSKKS